MMERLRINALLVAERTPVAAVQPLAHFLSSAQAQFITGQKILLSALIRDDMALRQARIAASLSQYATVMPNPSAPRVDSIPRNPGCCCASCGKS